MNADRYKGKYKKNEWKNVQSAMIRYFGKLDKSYMFWRELINTNVLVSFCKKSHCTAIELGKQWKILLYSFPWLQSKKQLSPVQLPDSFCILNIHSLQRNAASSFVHEI